MKILAYILSLYILVLTAIPCIDIPYNNSLQKIELTTKTTDNHQNDIDDCSPFCTCQCCATPVVFQISIIDFKSFSFSKKIYSEYTSNYISSLNASIWQPPKLI
jgi:hypothetical protein